ncbi:metal ion (Mn2+-iron) transporter, Nramp family [Galdieria sulphuraria]|uniref:Metal ion (Mn2+-iron) transporter, Nramp family n=1 Tax=Galdieria sulphuraria TaxID=130081 RepID=M2Y572_GALSU|nr:metal ion (Mn2+-iron) transporter, Nramp family [Galdieria sulphuraria]EME31004.1 metal ion (Mn2+-iron) transporter, Nramp family [Galdieria sulphuraria]|eukprot:XP_005707524.1 metal ion (Mn2+-iron) transporter, Nramp family [Galdieria sulphuraria]
MTPSIELLYPSVDRKQVPNVDMYTTESPRSARLSEALVEPFSGQSANLNHPEAVKKFSFGKLLKQLGPAFLVSIGYLDPGNWATDIEGGSRFGYELLWVLALSNMMGVLLQTLASRLGIVTKRHLAEMCRLEYPTWCCRLLWLFAELAIVATDLAEVIGTAIGLNLVFRIPLLVGVLITMLDTFILLIVQSYGMRRFEYLIFIFLAIISSCFVLELLFSKPSVTGILMGFIPRLRHDSIYIAIGMIGATVMPHNLFLHSKLVQDRVVDRHIAVLRNQCFYNLVDSVIALNAALFINCSILIVAAASFWRRGIDVTTLQKAHELLHTIDSKLWGIELAPLLFGIALIAAGQSSTLCGTLAGQFVMEGFLDMHVSPLFQRLLSRSLAIIPSCVVILLFGDEGSYQLLIFSQVVLSLQLPFAIIPVIRFTGSVTKMGKFANSFLVNTMAWLAACLCIGLNSLLVFDSLIDGIHSSCSLCRFFEIAVGVPLYVLLQVLLLWLTFREESSIPQVSYHQTVIDDENNNEQELLQSSSPSNHHVQLYVPSEETTTSKNELE